MLHDSLQLDLGHKGRGWGCASMGRGHQTQRLSCWQMVSFTQGHFLTKSLSFISGNNEAKEQLLKRKKTEGEISKK